jgi:hypothetical protein
MVDHPSFFAKQNWWYDACRDPRSLYYNTHAFPPVGLHVFRPTH